MKVIIKPNFLPATLIELKDFILVNREKLKAYKAKLRLINSLNLAKDVKDETLKEAQEVAQAGLWAEVRMGELLEEIPKKGKIKEYGSSGGTIPTLPKGITKKMSHQAQTLAKNQEIVQRTIVKAMEKGYIPTRRDIERLISDIEREKRIVSPMPLPEGIFDVVYADPPWKYDNSSGLLPGQAIRHYPLMATEEIMALKVPSANNAVLFLWVTNPFLKDGLMVAEEWGFEYKTNIVWIKKERKKPGIGFYVRGWHELLFICVKGSMLPQTQEVIGSVVEADVQVHSKKPEEIYNIIETLYPKGRYLELFARTKREKWVAWGTDSNITMA